MAKFNVHFWRHRAHQAFDQLWSGPDAIMSRRNAYVWMSRVMRLPSDKAHVAQFDIDKCRRLINECKRLGFRPTAMPEEPKAQSVAERRHYRKRRRGRKR